ncbi:MAG: ABC transporter permease, partial [Xanthomonadales bacterium]|nr:ABC transporter permease [Xanthomonadales bacterium]
MTSDIRLALRSLLRAPVFTLAAVLMLAVGIGLSIYMFAAINAFALKPLPFAEPERLVHFEYTDARDASRNLALDAADWLDLRERQHSLESLAAYMQGTASLGGIDGAPERLAGAFVSADAFAVLGVAPVLGRSISEADMRAGAPRVALLGQRVWQLRFNADPGVIGRNVRVNGEPTTIVGVMPEGFGFPIAESIWLPLSSDRALVAAGPAPRVKTYGRLRAGVSRDQAEQEFGALMRGLADERGVALRGDRPKLEPFSEEFILPQIRHATKAMFVAVLLVLLIACANVASLILARSAARTRERAIRSALGASRRRLVLEVLVETSVIALAATVLGWFGADLAARAFDTLGSAGTRLPYWVDFSVDLRDLAFYAGIALAATLLAGLVPALRAGRVDVQ